jgi:hypothetical protein
MLGMEEELYVMRDDDAYLCTPKQDLMGMHSLQIYDDAVVLPYTPLNLSLSPQGALAAMAAYLLLQFTSQVVENHVL